MPKERLSMRKIREVLRLKYELGRSNREIARSCDIGSSTVSDHLKRPRMKGLTWPLADDQSDIFPNTGAIPVFSMVGFYVSPLEKGGLRGICCRQKQHFYWMQFLNRTMLKFMMSY